MRLNRMTVSFRRPWPLLIILASLSAGCPHDPMTPSYARRKPAPEDLVGTYKLASQSLSDRPIAELKSPAGLAPGACTITLHAGGEFEYRNLPLWVGNWANGVDQGSVKEFKSGSGTWEIDVVGSTRDASGVVQLYGLKFADAAVADSIMLFGAEPPYNIILSMATRTPDTPCDSKGGPSEYGHGPVVPFRVRRFRNTSRQFSLCAAKIFKMRTQGRDHG